MWTMASSITDKYSDLKHLFYARARKYVEADYVKGFGEHMISVAHCQAHILLACYEMKMMYFPRAWINTGAAVRLAQMYVYHILHARTFLTKQDRFTSTRWRRTGREAVSPPTQRLDRARGATANFLDGILRGPICEYRHGMAHDY